MEVFVLVGSPEFLGALEGEEQFFMAGVCGDDLLDLLVLGFSEVLDACLQWAERYGSRLAQTSGLLRSLRQELRQPSPEGS